MTETCKLRLAVIALILLAFFSCREKCRDPGNPGCENYDPCYGKRVIDTYFLVRDGNGSFPPNPPECGENLASDTLLAAWVEFEAPRGNTDNCTYEWTIGTDPKIYTSKKFEVNFSNWLMQGNYNKHLPVNLTIKRPLDGCMDPKDTLTQVSRNIYILQDTSSRRVYVGYFEHAPDVKDTVIFLDVEPARYFRGEQFQFGAILLIGLPTSYKDTCLFAGATGYSCGRGYKYNYTKFVNNPDEKRGYLTSVKEELIAFEKWRFTWGVQKTGHPSEYVFICSRVW